MSIPKISLGTCTMGSQVGHSESFRILDAAVDRGIRFFDTAEGYPTLMVPETHGVTEQLIGDWLRIRRDRDRMMINTKIVWPGYPIRGGADYSPAQMRAALEGSLKRLGTDYVDVFMLHAPDRDPANHPEQMEAIGALIRAGKARAWALSNTSYELWEDYCLAADAAGVPRPIVSQNRFAWGVDPSGQAQCPVPLMAYGVLNYGGYSGKYAAGVVPPRSRLAFFRDKYEMDIDAMLRDEHTSRWLSHCLKEGIDPVHAAIEFVLDHPHTENVCLAVTSIDQLDHILESTQIAEAVG